MVLFLSIFAAGLLVIVFAGIVWLTGYWKRMAAEFIARREERRRKLESLGISLFPERRAHINPV